MELDTAGTGYTYKWSFQFLIGFMQSKCLIRMFSLKQTNHTVSIPYRVHAMCVGRKKADGIVEFYQVSIPYRVHAILSLLRPRSQ